MPEAIKLYFLRADVARALEASEASTRIWEKRQLLRAAATTPSGVSLFDPQDVENFRRRRQERAR
jgi:DNA-binding transcriptional MerR regulator